MHFLALHGVARVALDTLATGITRPASSHIRVGTFEFFAARTGAAFSGSFARALPGRSSSRNVCPAGMKVNTQTERHNAETDCVGKVCASFRKRDRSRQPHWADDKTQRLDRTRAIGQDRRRVRLVIGVFVDQDHRQQARAGEAAGDRMEGRRRLTDLLARPDQVSLPSADRLLDALNSFQTALTWPEAQQRIQALLKRGLQRDDDFEKQWPALLGALLET